jgi:hypothetical protein
MANTYVDYTATAGQTDFNFSFPYLENDHVEVFINGVKSTAFTISLSPTRVVLDTAATGGETIRVRRSSDPTEDLVDFVNGSVLTESDLDRAYLHNRYLNEEAFEGNTASLQTADGSTNFDANFNKIINLSPPTNSLDAANKNYVDDKLVLSGTSLSGFNKSTHTGDNATTTFTLSFTPQTGTASAFRVAIDGVLQTPDDAYTVDSGASTITFTSAPPTNAEIVVIATGTAQDVNSIGVTATGSTTARTLADRFSDSVNLFDFIPSSEHAGIVAGTLTYDASGDIQNAIDSISEGTIYLPTGDYRVDNTIEINKNNVHLCGLTTATLVTPPTVSLGGSDVVINAYKSTGGNPVNVAITNVNVEVSSNGGTNFAGIRWGCSYSSLNNVNVRIKEDNIYGIVLQTDDGGTGPYYNTFNRVFVQGDSNSVTPLTGVTGVLFNSAPSTASRSPNANAFVGCRVGSCYNAYDVKGARNTFISCTSEAINNYHYYMNHPTVSSGSVGSTVLNPYCENYPTSTVMFCNANASSNQLLYPYYTGVGTVLTDNSTLQNNRKVEASDIVPSGTPLVRAAAKVTGTTINVSHNVSTVTNPSTGIYKVDFTDTFTGTTNYYVSCIASGSNLTARISIQDSAYIQVAFFDDAGAVADPTGFTITASL